jgi:hypothetical protein
MFDIYIYIYIYIPDIQKLGRKQQARHNRFGTRLFYTIKNPVSQTFLFIELRHSMD